MEARPGKKSDNTAFDSRIEYKISKDNGQTWSKKKIIDDPQSSILGNPYLVTDGKENAFLVFMNVNKDFFSGNISLYQWDINDDEFHLKSIPVSSKNSLLDKPALAINGDTIYLTYVEYTQKLENGYLKYLYSKDDGKTWSNPKKVADDETIYLGASSQSLGKNLYLAYGTMWQKRIYFKKANFDQLEELSLIKSQAVAVVSDTILSAMTELAVGKKGNIAIGWLLPHKPNEVYISISQDEGITWKKLLLLSKSGNLLSLTFDSSNNLLCLYSDFENNSYSVVYKKIPMNYEDAKIKTVYLKKPSNIIGKRDYFGAFQKILHIDKKRMLPFGSIILMTINYIVRNGNQIKKLALIQWAIDS